MPDTSSTSVDTVLGRLVVERGLATADEVAELVQTRDTEANNQSLSQMLVERGLVTRKQIERLLPEIEEQRATRQIPGYQMLERLGAGAMATVYKARQLSLDRMVAIKVLPRKHTNNKQFVERFYAEGRAAAKLNHPNIVGALDVGQHGETHYFVMEYVEGNSVFEELQANGRYEESRALEIAIQTAKALEHAHKAGFIHRDVKPKNIMITRNGTAKLADMGLARAISDREAAEAEAGKAFGTPYYISPEQIRGEVDVDARADIYGLGATLYHMVTGQVPFDGPNPSAVMHKHLKEDLTPPDHINKDLTNGLAEIIEVAMAKDRKKRYATAGDMQTDLEAVARGEAPPQARRLFDLVSLSALDSEAEETAASSVVSIDRAGPAPPLTSQPIFWVAVAGWLLAVGLIIMLLTIAGN